MELIGRIDDWIKRRELRIGLGGCEVNISKIETTKDWVLETDDELSANK